MFASQTLLILQSHRKCGLFQKAHLVIPSTVVLSLLQNSILFYFCVSSSVVLLTWNYSCVSFTLEDDEPLTVRGFDIAYLFSYCGI